MPGELTRAELLDLVQAGRDRAALQDANIVYSAVLNGLTDPTLARMSAPELVGVLDRHGDRLADKAGLTGPQRAGLRQVTRQLQTFLQVPDSARAWTNHRPEPAVGSQTRSEAYAQVVADQAAGSVQIRTREIPGASVRLETGLTQVANQHTAYFGDGSNGWAPENRATEAAWQQASPRVYEGVAFVDAKPPATVNGPSGPEPAVHFEYRFDAEHRRTGVEGLPMYDLPRDQRPGGNTLEVNALLPASVADRLKAEISRDPAAARVVAEQLVLQNGGLDRDVWEGRGGANPVRPPWEQVPKTEPIEILTQGVNGPPQVKPVYQQRPGELSLAGPAQAPEPTRQERPAVVPSNGLGGSPRSNVDLRSAVAQAADGTVIVQTSHPDNLRARYGARYENVQQRDAQYGFGDGARTRGDDRAARERLRAINGATPRDTHEAVGFTAAKHDVVGTREVVVKSRMFRPDITEQQQRVVGEEPTMVDGPSGPEPGVHFTYTYRTDERKPGMPAYNLPSGPERGGNTLNVHAVLPKSVADRLQAAIQEDPAVARQVAERLVLDNGGLDPAAWEGTGGDRQMKPPYEQTPRTEPIQLVTEGPDGKLVAEPLYLGDQTQGREGQDERGQNHEQQANGQGDSRSGDADFVKKFADTGRPTRGHSPVSPSTQGAADLHTRQHSAAKSTVGNGLG